MSNPYLGQVIAVGFNFAPRGWALCDGRLLPIAQNTALFSLIGTTFGGDGKTTFGLPDLRGRVVVGSGQGPGLSNRVQGQQGGTETVTLTGPQVGPHAHGVMASGPTTNPTAYGPDPDPSSVPGAAPGGAEFYTPLAANAVALSPNTLSATGGGQPHENRQPYLTINYIIALEGAYPSRP